MNLTANPAITENRKLANNLIDGLIAAISSGDAAAVDVFRIAIAANTAKLTDLFLAAKKTGA